MRNLIITLLAAVIWLPRASPAESAAEAHSDVEARFLVTFFKFIHWPHESDNASICFLDASAVRNSIDDAVSHNVSWAHLKGRIVVTKVLPDLTVTDDCNILWIDASRVEQTWDKITIPQGVFTVSDSKKFAHNGGMFQFTWLAGNDYRLSINVANVTRSGLAMSGALGTLADLIDSQRPPM